MSPAAFGSVSFTLQRAKPSGDSKKTGSASAQVTVNLRLPAATLKPSGGFTLDVVAVANADQSLPGLIPLTARTCTS